MDSVYHQVLAPVLAILSIICGIYLVLIVVQLVIAHVIDALNLDLLGVIHVLVPN